MLGIEMNNLIYLVLMLSLKLGHSYIPNPYANLRFEEFIQKLGYPMETHTVITKDAYILTVYRITNGKTNTSNSSAVLFGHGLFVCAIDWINAGEKSLPIILLESGYDVWLTNNRGTSYSKKHLTLNANKHNRKYWDFSLHEIGVYDYSSVIDYIIDKTGQPKIYYIGHSQGGGAMFVLLSEKPEYNNKLRLFTALAPATFMKHSPSVLLRLIQLLYYVIQLARDIFKYNIAIWHTQEITDFGIKYCSDGAPTQKLCPSLFYFLGGYSPYQMNKTLLPVLYSSFPEASSTKQLLHFAQLATTGKFSQYDYGIKNLKKYSSLKPPEYNLSKINCPVAIHLAKNDAAVSVEDITKLKSQLANVVTFQLVDDKYFNHFDFLSGTDANKLVYQYILATMKLY